MDSLKGHFLIATPEMSDERFVETLVYLVAHSEEGAMGLVVNKPMPDMRFSDILEEIELGADSDFIRIPERLLDKDVLRGGPVDASRGFVLHTADYFRDGNSYVVEDNICLTATLDVLRAIAAGSGPEKSLLALGYCGWGAGQLEAELKQNGWLTVDHSDELLFSVPPGRRYDAALAALGVTRATLAPHTGGKPLPN
ncbi:YqgE/AlgH family protein [Pelagibacterium montanilacus]|uniref:YqgE/AlgH family protein n=1 Tax=Pelagibacterium montanilacus TaxID=2185280 RepID=UPI000F8E3A86|nr:YqgE/AlgH family protein [Pelagibacterium montanilacus]